MGVFTTVFAPKEVRATLDELVRIGAMDSEYAEEQTALLAEGIREVG
jgi:hypothetical protein